jgi:LysM repeat protein
VGPIDHQSWWVITLNAGLVVLIVVLWLAIFQSGGSKDGTATASNPSAATSTQSPNSSQSSTISQAPATTGTSYTVASGDSLASIGDKLGIDWHRIADANKVAAPYNLTVGQKLTIPSQ